MIYIDPGERRADTMSIVNEGCAARHYATGEFKLIANACGYTELVMRNLAAFFDAGVIEPSPKPADRVDNGDWEILRWTRTGHYLWRQWAEGPLRAVVELPQPGQGEQPPKSAMDMLADAGWPGKTILNVWTVPGGWIVEAQRWPEDDGPPEEIVFTLDSRGLAVQAWPRAEAAAWAATLLAAAR